MIQESMIEKVARAIYFRGEDQGDEAWKHAPPGRRAIAIEQAQAALEAMREPSAAMLHTGFIRASSATGDEENAEWVAKDIWQAMITEALKEGA